MQRYMNDGQTVRERLEMGYGALAAGDFSTARACFEDAQDRLPHSEVPGVLMATLDLLEGRLMCARARLVAWLRRDPKSVLARLHLVEVYVAMGRFRAARAELTRAGAHDMTPELHRLYGCMSELLSAHQAEGEG